MSFGNDTLLINDSSSPWNQEAGDEFLTAEIGASNEESDPTSAGTYLSRETLQRLAQFFSPESAPTSLSESLEANESGGLGAETLIATEGDTSSPGKARQANRDRLKLLSRQFVRKELSNEDQARLEIVSERVRALIPRVTSDDWERLESIALRIEVLTDANSKLRSDLKLDERE